MAASVKKVRLNDPMPTARSRRLAKLDAEVARLKALLAQKRKLHDRNISQHISKWDHAANDRFQLEHKDLEDRLRDLADQRYAIEIADEDQPAAPSSPSAKVRREWPIRDLPEPQYPVGARARGQMDLLQKGLNDFIDFQTDHAMKAMKAAGIGRDVPVTYEVLSTVIGQIHGYAEWTGARLKELQDRLDAVEAGGVEYAGVHQRASTYRKGSIVTCAGSAWVALRQVAEGEVPGDAPAAWQLLVRRGSDGKDFGR